MTNITNEQRDSAYQTATELQKYLYQNPASGLRLRNIADKHNITTASDYYNFAVTAGDVVLQLLDRSELTEVLSSALNLDTEQTLKLTADLTDFLDQTIIHSDQKLIKTITESVVPAPPHIRTANEALVPNQGTEEATYSSTQADLLSK